MDKIPASWEDSFLSPESQRCMRFHFVNEICAARAFFTSYGQVFTPSLAKKHPALKIIAYNGTSPPLVDPSIRHKYDLVWLYDTDILKTITPTAEHTLGLLMAADRGHRRAWDDVSFGSYDRYMHGAPKMLSRSKLTIIGRGRIGLMLTKIALPLFERVFSIEKDDWGDEEDIAETLGQTDFLAICASYDPSSAPIITAGILDLLPRGAVVINTSRGENLDNMALIQAMSSGHIRAAALDVLPSDHDVFGNLTSRSVINYAKGHTNLLLTPHIAGSTKDAWNETQQGVIVEVHRRLTDG